MKKLITTGIVIMFLVTLLFPMTGCNGDKKETKPVTSESNCWLELLSILPENETTLSAACIQTSEYRDMLKRYYDEKSEEPVLQVEQFAYNNL